MAAAPGAAALLQPGERKRRHGDEEDHVGDERGPHRLAAHLRLVRRAEILARQDAATLVPEELARRDGG